MNEKLMSFGLLVAIGVLVGSAVLTVSPGTHGEEGADEETEMPILPDYAEPASGGYLDLGTWIVYDYNNETDEITEEGEAPFSIALDHSESNDPAETVACMTFLTEEEDHVECHLGEENFFVKLDCDGPFDPQCDCEIQPDAIADTETKFCSALSSSPDCTWNRPYWWRPVGDEEDRDWRTHPASDHDHGICLSAIVWEEEVDGAEDPHVFLQWRPAVREIAQNTGEGLDPWEVEILGTQWLDTNFDINIPGSEEPNECIFQDISDDDELAVASCVWTASAKMDMTKKLAQDPRIDPGDTSGFDITFELSRGENSQQELSLWCQCLS